MSLEGNENEYAPSGEGEPRPASESDGLGNKLPTIQPQSPPSTPPPNEEPSKWRENTELGLTIGGLVVVIAYTIFSGLQWAQIRWTNRLTREALDGNGIALQQTLTKLQGQIDQEGRQADNTHTLADRMKDQADRTKDLADQAKIQSHESTIAADAARSAADTAKDALHVSERAYLTVNSSQFDFDSGTVAIAITNTGHLPSGKVELKVFEVNAYNPNPQFAGAFPVVERHWNISVLNGISTGPPWTYYISIPGVTADGVNSGHQVVQLGGILTYNDGFADTPDQIGRFCIRSVFDAKAKKPALVVCDPDAALDKLIRDVGYPANKENVPQ